VKFAAQRQELQQRRFEEAFSEVQHKTAEIEHSKKQRREWRKVKYTLFIKLAYFCKRLITF